MGSLLSCHRVRPTVLSSLLFLPFRGIPSHSTLLFTLYRGLVCFPPYLSSSFSYSVSQVFQAVHFSFLHVNLMAGIILGTTMALLGVSFSMLMY